MEAVQIQILLELMQVNKLEVSRARLAFDYSPEVENFLRKANYNFCIQDDAFGVQIVISDANHTIEISKSD